MKSGEENPWIVAASEKDASEEHASEEHASGKDAPERDFGEMLRRRLKPLPGRQRAAHREDRKVD